jgi:hypothetical protein
MRKWAESRPYCRKRSLYQFYVISALPIYQLRPNLGAVYDSPNSPADRNCHRGGAHRLRRQAVATAADQRFAPGLERYATACREHAARDTHAAANVDRDESRGDREGQRRDQPERDNVQGAGVEVNADGRTSWQSLVDGARLKGNAEEVNQFTRNQK